MRSRRETRGGGSGSYLQQLYECFLRLVYVPASWRQRGPYSVIEHSKQLQFTVKPLGDDGCVFLWLMSDSLVFFWSDSERWQLGLSGCFWKWSLLILNNKCCWANVEGQTKTFAKVVCLTTESV